MKEGLLDELKRSNLSKFIPIVTDSSPVVIKSTKLQRRRLKRFLERYVNDVSDVIELREYLRDYEEIVMSAATPSSSSSLLDKQKEVAEFENINTLRDTLSREEEEEQKEVTEFCTELMCVFSVLIAVVLTYRHAIFEPEHIEYLNFDDDVNFKGNQYIRSNLSWESIEWILREGQILGVYEPVSLLFKAFVIWFFRPKSIEEEAQVMLKMSVILHVFNSVLCIFVCNQLVLSIVSKTKHHVRWTSCTLASLLVALHPLRVEATSWASGQSYLLCTTMCLLSLLSYMSRNSKVQAHIYLFLATMCKAPAISFPIVFIAYDLIVTGRGVYITVIRQLVRGHYIILIVQTLLTFYFLIYGPSNTQGMKIRDMESIEILTRALHCPSRYLFQSFNLPTLSPVYSIPDERMTPFSTTFLPTTLATLATTLISTYYHKSYLGIAWFTYLGLLLPTLGLVSSHIWGLAADRYAHIPCTVLLAPVLSVFLCKIIKRKSILTVLAAVLIASSLKSTQYAKVWRNSKSLWTHNVQAQPNNAFALNNLASTIWLEPRDNYDQVMELYRKSLSLNPYDIDALSNTATVLGIPYRNKKDWEEALKYVNRLRKLRPNALRVELLTTSLYHSRLRSLGNNSNDDDVRVVNELYANIVQRDDLNVYKSEHLAKVYNHYGLFLNRYKKEYMKSLRYHRLAVELEPDNLDFVFQLGVTLQLVEQYEDAAKQFRHVLHFRKNDVNVRLYLAGALGDSGDIVGASYMYSLVVKQEPNNARANAGLGSALATEGRNEEAVQYLERGAKLDPTLIPILRDSMIALYNRLQLKFPSRVEFVEGLRKWEGEGEG